MVFFTKVLFGAIAYLCLMLQEVVTLLQRHLLVPSLLNPIDVITHDTQGSCKHTTSVYTFQLYARLPRAGLLRETELAFDKTLVVTEFSRRWRATQARTDRPGKDANKCGKRKLRISIFVLSASKNFIN